MGFVEDIRFREFGARCVFFDRFGGVSNYPFDSLNVSTSVGDTKENVEKNLEIIKSELNTERIATLNQIHSNKIVKLSKGKKFEADGFYTEEPLVFLGIKFADCLPIVLMDVKKRIIMAIHAGWRGSYLGISKEAVKTFVNLGSNPENITATIGPHICKNCYEVKEDVASRFPKHFSTIKKGKIYLDLSGINIEQLLESGVKRGNIIDLNICTFENRDFFSYRRDKICGRNIGGIMLIDTSQK